MRGLCQSALIDSNRSEVCGSGGSSAAAPGELMLDAAATPGVVFGEVLVECLYPGWLKLSSGTSRWPWRASVHL